MGIKIFLPALKYILWGPMIFWVPSVALHLLRGYSFSGIEALTLTILLPLITCTVLVSYWKRTPQSKIALALLAVFGIWLFGPLMMTISASNAGGGFARRDGLHFVLVGTCMFPFFAFIMSTYDGTLGALLLTSILLPLVGAFCGRAHHSDWVRS